MAINGAFGDNLNPDALWTNTIGVFGKHALQNGTRKKSTLWKNNNADVGARSSRPSFNMERIPPVERGGVIPPLQSAKTGHEQTLIQRQIDATDRQIDKLVYELYDLTEEEIAIMEGN